MPNKQIVEPACLLSLLYGRLINGLAVSAGLDSPTDYGLAGYDAEKAAARTAVQAAAGALINVTCQTCDDIVLCAGPREETDDEVSPFACSKRTRASPSCY